MLRICRQHAFTVPELLACVAIIVILLAILLPSLQKAREAARDAQCRSQLHQVGLAFMTLGAENRSRLPGVWGPPWTGPQPLEGPFMGKEVFKPYYLPSPVSNKMGTLVPYLGGAEAARAIYRCPSLSFEGFRSGVGSNGMFDYTMIQAFPGAYTARVPASANYIEPVTNKSISTPVPLVIEENPAFGINKDFVDMGHTSINRFATTHFGNGGNYLSLGGSAHRLIFPSNPGPEGYAWTAQASSGTVNLGIAKVYGGWN